MPRDVAESCPLADTPQWREKILTL